MRGVDRFQPISDPQVGSTGQRPHKTPVQTQHVKSVQDECAKLGGPIIGNENGGVFRVPPLRPYQ